jgi:Zn-dependent peptidase ImmA (M78 family)
VLTLDRMFIEEQGPNPERLAAAIHDQLNQGSGPVPVYDVAEALDIIEIRVKPLRSLEGALVTTPDRNAGSIAVSSGSNPARRRFTVAHELGHFLNLWHQPQGASGFSCTRADFASGWRGQSASTSQHLNQEREANRFAIELLAPLGLARPFLFGVPDLEKVLNMSEALGVSREACARRYVELHRQPTSVVFTTDGVVRYVERHADFPFVSCVTGQRFADLPSPAGEDCVSSHIEADPRDWLTRPGGGSLVIQTLRQQGGYGMTLLILEKETGDEY